MPSCRVTNKTGLPLNICLKQVAALHFENTIKPDQDVKFKPGRVWFTLEAQVDDGSKASRYSVMKSAATIGLLSIAVGAVAATAGAALLPASAAAGAAAGAATTASYLSKAGWVARTALVKNAGTIGKISSVAVPKAVEKISAEIGGLTALQKEVLSIIASPTLSADVRNKATHLLRSLYSAYSHDKTADSGPVGPSIPSASISLINPSALSSATTTREAQTLSSGLNTTHADTHVETRPFQTGSILRVHGIYMDRSRHFEIRVNSAGLLDLWDAEMGRVWEKTAEAERDKLERAEKKRADKEAKAAKKLLAAQEKEKKLAEAKDTDKEKVGWVEWGKAKVSRSKTGTTSTAATTDDSSAGEETDDEGDDGESTSVMLNEEKEGEVRVLVRRPTVKERLEGLVHPAPQVASPLAAQPSEAQADHDTSGQAAGDSDSTPHHAPNTQPAHP